METGSIKCSYQGEYGLSFFAVNLIVWYGDGSMNLMFDINTNYSFMMRYLVCVSLLQEEKQENMDQKSN